ncbi:MAG: ComEA family DNA-binding protein [Gemmatimonadetes bacterium]|mgnify:FL=1|jgi:competence protein ComEA|nr:ComEA family DNA-binding protein [Gemmatimonadota bacterium]MBT5060307.1 ComEA family DNA-binding protein [Gemmatimonadota bacterium]MBT5145624.1 ComEA family DNA-binding protein [Gemmatimonadota bacterium]MBT5588146.1 ComEA family DNA-binding protein [Gemmatimonadota bacterium]MBT5960688.1 ComEA family DNA-binding protein [Gemmatimonadota bacterium]
MALLFLTGTLLLGCFALVVEAVRQDGLEDFHVIRAAVAPPQAIIESQAEAPVALYGIATPQSPQIPIAASSVVGGADSVQVVKVISSIGINSADIAQWVALPGIGPRTAEAIIDHRRQQGRFVQIEDLTQVRGIGVRTLERLRPHVHID